MNKNFLGCPMAISVRHPDPRTWLVPDPNSQYFSELCKPLKIVLLFKTMSEVAFRDEVLSTVSGYKGFLTVSRSPLCSVCPVLQPYPAQDRPDSLQRQPECTGRSSGRPGARGHRWRHRQGDGEILYYSLPLCLFCRSSGRPGARGHWWRHRQGDGEILYHTTILPFLPIFRPPRCSWRQWHTGSVSVRILMTHVLLLPVLRIRVPVPFWPWTRIRDPE